MPVRLPVCGDWIDEALVCGVSARGFRGQPSIVTVWIAPNDEEGGEVHVFQQFEVSTLARAQQVRDQIAYLCGLDGEVQDAFDPEDPDASGGDGGEGSENESEEQKDGSDGSMGAAQASLTPAEAAEILASWEPESKHRH